MKQTFATRRLGAVKLSLLMASIGFAYALITSASPKASATVVGVGGRALGTGCTRLPLEFVTGSDLGAVVVGTTAVGNRELQHPLRPLEYGARLIRKRLEAFGLIEVAGKEPGHWGFVTYRVTEAGKRLLPTS